jgi:hypothetical protein
MGVKGVRSQESGARIAAAYALGVVESKALVNTTGTKFSFRRA